MLTIDFDGFSTEYLEVFTEFGEEAKAEEINLSAFYSAEKKQYLVDVDVREKHYSDHYFLEEETELITKRLKKRFLKLSLYKALSSYFNKVLPWGALTGIRPTKLCYMNGAEHNAKKFLMEEMLVSEKKAELAARIIEQQKPYYGLAENKCSLFVNIPFCPTRCAYCSFLSNEISKEKYVNEYIEGLTKEIEASKPLLKNLQSVYIGGGTPVSITEAQLESVLKAIGRVGVEYTVEAGRPDCITREKLQLLKDYGVTRVCVNPQTFCDKTLQQIGRKHTAAETIEKFKLAKEFGFDVNMDLIAGLMGEDYETFKASVDKAISLSPDNITVHTLSLKRGSKIHDEMSRADATYISEMLEYSQSALQNNGYMPYYLYRLKNSAGNHENTGYAKEGKACVYNIVMMEEITNIVACGANSVSKRLHEKNNEIVRLGAPKDIKTYIEKIDVLIKDKNQLF